MGQELKLDGQGTWRQVALVPQSSVLMHSCQQPPRKQLLPAPHCASVVQPVLGVQVPTEYDGAWQSAVPGQSLSM